MNKVILIIEDDISFGTMLQKWINKNGFESFYCSSLERAKEEIRSRKIDLVLSDLRLPDGDGIMLLHWIHENKYNLPIILITGYAEVSTAVSAMKLGAEDFLEKPINTTILKEKIDKVFGTKSSAISSVTVKDNVKIDSPEQKMIIGSSPATLRMVNYVKKVAPTNMTVLIIGESGTGKEFTARLIHDYSKRKDKPFIALDCGSLSKELAPSELFGHLKGSFTSAINNKVGAFEQANGGTVFLDEVGNLSYEVQIQLLRALQEQKIRPVGAVSDISVDVRIIAATNDDLEASMKKGNFREDLYHRLNEFSLLVPPLRDRLEDIRDFANGFLQSANKELDRDITGFTEKAMDILKKYRWGGNVRELRNVIRRAVLFAQENVITENDLSDLKLSGEPISVKEPITSQPEDYALRPGNEKEQIEKVLYKTRGNKTLAAQLLKVDRKTLYNKMHLYGIEL